MEYVCNRLGIHIYSNGPKLWCDIIGEKTISCYINLDKNYWYDFGTSTGGDVIKFVSKVEKEIKSYTYIDIISCCDNNDIELVPLRKEKTKIY